MNMRDLIPWGRDAHEVPSMYRNEQASPFLTLHREAKRSPRSMTRSANSASGIMAASNAASA
jgi:hypothetical protein